MIGRTLWETARRRREEREEDGHANLQLFPPELASNDRVTLPARAVFDPSCPAPERAIPITSSRCLGFSQATRFWGNSLTIAPPNFVASFAPAGLRNVLSPKLSLRHRLFSTPPAPNASHKHQRSAPAKRKSHALEQVRESVARKLASANPAAAIAVVHQALDRSNLDNPSRFSLYEYAVASFLRCGDVMKAAMLYSRMTREGYIPSVSLRIQMHIVKLAELAVPRDVLFDTIREAFAQQAFDELALRDLLRMLVEGLQCLPEFVRQVADKYLESRGPGYTLSAETTTYLVHAYEKGTDSRDSSRLSNDPSLSPAPSPQPVSVDLSSTPYTTLLRDLAASKPSFEVYKWTLERMRADNIQPDLPFFNALLAYEVGRRNYEVVFAIYKMLMEKRSERVKPSAHTFSTIFRVLHRLASSHRYRRTHGLRVPSNIPTLRSVYQDLLTCHLEYTRPKPNKPSPTLDSTALHKALRAFLSRQDFAGAYTAVRAFRLFPAAVGQPTIATYRLVFGGILGLIRAQYPAAAARMASGLAADDIWAYRFLGLDALPSHLRATVPLDLSMVHRVLLVGADSRLSFAYFSVPDYVKPRRTLGLGDIRGLVYEEDEEDEEQRVERICNPAEFYPHGMPTPVELTALKHVPDNRTYKVAPLERVLRRAIAASTPPDGEPLAKRVSDAIAEAKREMVARS
ncbi:hypothetical protein C2E23DRAFT_884908 [Lenzites betulinus]|nr:hypothetical protein C2E23DRAFT_884908 [Lenzites betulinus]